MTQHFTGILLYYFLQLHPNNTLSPQAVFHTPHNATFPSERDIPNLTQQDAYLLWVLRGGSQEDCGN